MFLRSEEQDTKTVICEELLHAAVFLPASAVERKKGDKKETGVLS